MAVNLIEVTFLLLAVAGALTGSVFGWQSYGALGAAAGALLGTAAGLVTAGGLTVLLALVAKALFGGTLGQKR